MLSPQAQGIWFSFELIDMSKNSLFHFMSIDFKNQNNNAIF